jgi:hypothetical protein
MSKVANGTIVKIDQEKQLVFGWASVIKDTNDKILLDRQEDFIESEDELEKAAYDYVLKSRDGGEMHIRKGVSTMVESVVLSKEKQLALGIPAGIVPIGWWIGFKVNDDRVWNEVKKGGYVGFSVHGTGKRHNEEIAFDKITEVEKCACEPQPVEKYNPQYWSVMRKAQIAIVENAISKGEGPGHPFRGNQWTRGKSGAGVGGAGKKSGKKKKLKLKRKKDIGEKDVREATKRLIAGEEVDMPNIAGAHTLIKKLAKVAVDAEKTGGKFVYDLCKVTVKGASAFCGGNKGIDRADMPQAKGEVVKGSKADKALQKQNAKRKEDGKEPKTEYDATKEFVAHMEKIGIKVSKPKAVDPASLKATQRNMQGEKVAGMMLAKDKSFLKEPIFVSRDGYIVDGHHRWAAVLGNDMKDGKLGNDMRKNVITLDAPISKILKEANKFTSEFGIKRKKVAGK